MALTVASSSTTAYATASSVTLTKPSGTAVGDLLMAVIHYAGGAGASSGASGWTQQITLNTNTLVFYIFATATEVAASSFTFNAGSSALIAGGIFRITGDINTSRMSNFATHVLTPTNGNPATHTITVTPTNAESLLLYSVTTISSAGTSAASGYAITTSNPSWTEVYDINNGSNSQMSLAYATRTAVTATGNASVTVTNCALAQITGIMIVIDPAFVKTTTESLTTTDVIVKTVGKVITESLTGTEAITKTKSKVWTGSSKSSITWTNASES